MNRQVVWDITQMSQEPYAIGIMLFSVYQYQWPWAESGEFIF